MRTLLKILTGLWTAFWIYAAVSMFLDTPRQIARDKKFIEEKIKPSVDFVKAFKHDNQRLPTEKEFTDWRTVDNHAEYVRKTIDIVSDDYNKVKDADWTKDFAIEVWRGEWMEYYFSWTDKYDGNNYTTADGFIGLGVMIGLGLFPLLFWWFNSWRRKKSMFKFTTPEP